MITIRATLMLALALGHTLAADRQPASVRFANDDTLSGQLMAISPEFITWQSPVLEEAASFQLDQVLELALPAPQPPRQVAHEALLTLTNGDTIRGQLASVSDHEVLLDTWFAGRLAFKRVMVSDLRIEKSAVFSYRGPTGMDGWRQSADPPAWTYERAAFRAQAQGTAGGAAPAVKVKATPGARRLAAELGLELDSIAASSGSGILREEDVRRAAAARG